MYVCGNVRVCVGGGCGYGEGDMGVVLCCRVWTLITNKIIQQLQV